MGVVLALLLGACSNAELFLLPEGPPPPFDNRLAVEGQVCTQSTDSLSFPLRVLYLVDGSESMAVTDPPDPETGETARERAVRESVTELLSRGGDVEVSVVRFSSQAQPLTVSTDDEGALISYFSDDLDFVLSRLYPLAETDRTTNYINALSEAYSEVRYELNASDQASLPLSTVHVILVSDGIPDAEQGETAANAQENLIEAVGAIMDLGSLFRLDEVAVHTALISSGSASVDARSQDLLEALAEEGDGSFRSFDSSDQLSFLYLDLSTLERVFTLRSLVAFNLNAVVHEDEVLADSDGDGLPDADELDWGLDPYSPDTDGDGCRDSVELAQLGTGLSALDPEDCHCLVPDFCFDEDEDGLCDSGCLDADEDGLCDCEDVDADGLCDPSNYPDSDGDGLVDCEERWSGTHRLGADTDADGLVDYLELRYGTSPDTDDAKDDLDWDAVPNGEELRTGTDPTWASPEGRYDQAYRYRITEGAWESGRTCYDLEVSNITLAELLPPPEVEGVGGDPLGQGWSGSSRVLLFAGEVPFDDPLTYARYRVACVSARVQRQGNYRDPPSGRVRVSEEDFVLLSEFDAEVHCAPPGGR